MRAGCATLLVAQQVGRRPRPTSTTPAPGSSASCACGRRSSPARRRAAATSPTLLPQALELADRAGERIPTPELNRFVADVVAKTPPPSRRGRRLRLYYAAQVGERPPRIAIQVNDRKLITRDWAYHLENRMRETYGLEGVPAGDRLRAPHRGDARPLRLTLADAPFV